MCYRSIGREHKDYGNGNGDGVCGMWWTKRVPKRSYIRVPNRLKSPSVDLQKLQSSPCHSHMRRHFPARRTALSPAPAPKFQALGSGFTDSSAWKFCPPILELPLATLCQNIADRHVILASFLSWWSCTLIYPGWRACSLVTGTNSKDAQWNMTQTNFKSSRLRVPWNFQKQTIHTKWIQSWTMDGNWMELVCANVNLEDSRLKGRRNHKLRCYWVKLGRHRTESELKNRWK